MSTEQNKSLWALIHQTGELIITISHVKLTKQVSNVQSNNTDFITLQEC